MLTGIWMLAYLLAFWLDHEAREACQADRGYCKTSVEDSPVSRAQYAVLALLQLALQF